MDARSNLVEMEVNCTNETSKLVQLRQAGVAKSQKKEEPANKIKKRRKQSFNFIQITNYFKVKSIGSSIGRGEGT